jgi:hypothetical protein
MFSAEDSWERKGDLPRDTYYARKAKGKSRPSPHVILRNLSAHIS